MDFFQAKVDHGTELATTPNFSETQLQEDYDLKENNCTTICVDAIGAVEGLEAEADALEGQYDPRELYTILNGLFSTAEPE